MAPCAREQTVGNGSVLPPFQTVLEEHRSPLYRYLVASVGHHDAADAFQETMLAALRAYPSLRHGDNLGGWLFTIAHRKVIDAARTGARRALPVAEVPEPARPAMLETSGDRHDELWAAVRRLPPKQRSAVVLRHVAGWPYADIAAVLACSSEAARQSVRVALARLRSDTDRSETEEER